LSTVFRNPTNKGTNGKHNLLGGGNNESSAPREPKCTMVTNYRTLNE